MSLSVVVPNYNHGRLIGRALRALATQSPTALEIIVVDDGSTDNSVRVIERLQRDHGFIRLIKHNVNRGVTAALQTGIDVARGEYLFVSAADDFVLPGLFDRAVTALRDNSHAALFCSSAAVINTQDKVIGFRPVIVPRAIAGYMSPDEVRRVLVHGDNWFIGTSVIYRRSYLAEIGYFDHSLGSLCDSMTNRLLALRHGVYYDPDVLTTWQVSPETFSARSSLSTAESARLIGTALSWIRQRFPEDVRDRYAALFERRLRFGMARLLIVWRKGALDIDAIARLANLTSVDRTLMRVLSKIPFISPYLVLAWMAIRMRPVSLSALLQGWWHNKRVNSPRRACIERLLSSEHPMHQNKGG